MKPRLHGPALVAVTVGAVAMLGSLPAIAWERSEPAPQWAVDAAKTPTPATASKAAAVVLFHEYRIIVDERNHAIERELYAVRILKPQGRNHAHCEASYDIDSKLNYFRAWTFTADGKVLPAKVADFTDQGEAEADILQFTARVRILAPPGGDPGAVVACETETQLRPYMSEELWPIQDSIPVLNEALDLSLPAGMHFAASWHNSPLIKPSETAENHLRWEIKEMPALDLENIHNTPAWNALAARASIQWGDTAVQGNNNLWHAIGLWAGNLEQGRHDPTPEITAKAQELTAGAPDLYTKLSRITDYIQKNIRYFIVVRGIGGWQPHYAGDIYRNKYGDCKDKTTLLISMLQAVGVPAHSLSVDDRRGFIDPTAPSRFGDHMITAIELPERDNDPRLAARVKAANGKTLLIFDPTDEVTPVGLIRGDLQGAWGYIANGPDSQVLQMPVLSPETAGLSRKGSFTLTADGVLTGDIAEDFTGDDATSERWFIKDNDTKEVHEKLESGLGSDLPGLTLKGYEFRQTADLNKPLGLDIHISTTSYAHTAGPLLLFRPRVLGSHVRKVADVMDGKPRAYSIELGHPGHWRDSFDIALPAGYVVDEIPDPVAVDLDFASYHSSVTAKGNLLHYERDYVVRKVEIPPAKAAAFRQFESAIVSDEKGTAVLRKQ
ncbi:MAG: DUF3857 and transglutaminase domain-containing protein [Terracidiphilus sp.]|nr:DUF3857 and transglutaminase domain-containing protein [Terracidiphilus sp.]